MEFNQLWEWWDMLESLELRIPISIELSLKNYLKLKRPT